MSDGELILWGVEAAPWIFALEALDLLKRLYLGKMGGYYTVWGLSLNGIMLFGLSCI